MFHITPVQDLATAKEYADVCGIGLKDGSFLYGMTDVESGKLMAVSEFEILENYG